MRVTNLILLILTCLTACASPVRHSVDSIYDQRQELKEVWQGYDPVARSVGYYQPQDGQVLLASDSTALGGFSQLSPGIWLSEQPFPQLRQSFYIETPLTDELNATLLRYSREHQNLFNTLFHEDFHGYQRDAFVHMSTSTLSHFDSGTMPLDVLVAALRTERILLIEILSTLQKLEERQHQKQLLLMYVALRWWREAQLPAASVRLERHIETLEGTANWVGFRSEQVLLGYARPSLIEKFKSNLRFDYEGHGESASVRLLNTRVYSTGAALSEILDLAAGSQWQVAVVQDEASLFELLQKMHSWPDEALQQAAEELIASPTFVRAVTKAAALHWPDTPDAILASLAQRRQWRLTLYLPTQQGSFNAPSDAIVPLEDNGLLLNPVTQYFNDSTLVNLKIRDLPLIIPRQVSRNSSDDETNDFPLVIFMNQLESSLRCTEESERCEGTTNSISQRGMTLRSQVPIRYKLERLSP